MLVSYVEKDDMISGHIDEMLRRFVLLYTGKQPQTVLAKGIPEEKNQRYSPGAIRTSELRK